MKIKGIKNMNELSTHKFTGLVLASLLVMCLFGCGESGTESVDVVEIPTIGQSSEAPKSSSSKTPEKVCVTIRGEQSECDGNYSIDKDFYKMSSSRARSSSSIALGENMILDSRNNAVYKTVKIGEQTWLAENMRYRNPLNTVTTLIFDKSLGYYYTRSAANQACPEGWHLPSLGEWQYLLGSLADPRFEDDDIYYTMAGNYLKSTETWDGRDRGNDSLGFGALASGIVEFEVQYGEGLITEFWTSTETESGYHSYVVRIVGNDNYAAITARYNEDAVSVRCVLGEPVVLSSSSVVMGSSSSSYADRVQSTGYYDCEVEDCVTTENLDSNFGYEEVKDSRDGKVYRVTKGANAYWLAQNLDYEMEGSVCGFSKDTTDTSCEKYGRLYSWDSAKVACPAGWHLPSAYEYSQNSSYDFNKMSLLEVGSFIPPDTYSSFSIFASFWTSTEYLVNPGYAYAVTINSETGEILATLATSKSYYMPIRCMREHI